MLEEMTCLLRFPGWTRCGFLWTTHVLGRGGFPSVGCNFCTGITKGEVHAAVQVYWHSWQCTLGQAQKKMQECTQPD